MTYSPPNKSSFVNKNITKFLQLGKEKATTYWIPKNKYAMRSYTFISTVLSFPYILMYYPDNYIITAYKNI